MYIELEDIETTGLAHLDGNIGAMEDAISSVQESTKQRKEDFKQYINQVRFCSYCRCT